MSKQSELLEYAESHVYYKEGFSGKHYSAEVCHNMNMFDERVRIHEEKHDGYICAWEEPYGFVPEASCPLHG